MDKRELSETENQSADYGPFLNVRPEEEEEEDYNPYKGVHFNVPPIIPNAVDIKRGGFEVNRKVRKGHSVLGKSYFGNVMHAIKNTMRRLMFWK